jgi:succinoglycan biosynthesis protein ExoA
MPVLNEVEHIEAAVLSLIDQDYTGPFEVVLALGPSVDGTNQGHRRNGAGRFSHPQHPERAGLDPRRAERSHRASSHPIVIRVDAHSVLPREYTRLGLRPCCAAVPTTWAGIMKAEGVTPFESAVAHAYGLEGRPGRNPTPRRWRGGPGRDRLPRHLPAAPPRRGRPLRRRHQARPGLGAQPKAARDRRNRVVHSRTRGRLPSAIQPQQAGRQFVATGIWRGELARRFSRERHPLLRATGAWCSASCSPASCSASSVS